jgi:hypothetical protein
MGKSIRCTCHCRDVAGGFVVSITQDIVQESAAVWRFVGNRRSAQCTAHGALPQCPSIIAQPIAQTTQQSTLQTCQQSSATILRDACREDRWGICGNRQSLRHIAMRVAMHVTVIVTVRGPWGIYGNRRSLRYIAMQVAMQVAVDAHVAVKGLDILAICDVH